MHERSLVRALLRQIDKLLAEHSQCHVVSVRVRIGELSGVEADLLASAYEDLVQDTPLQDASLIMERVPLEAVCDQCGHQFRIERFRFECDQCGSLRLSLRGGEELLLDSVVLEDLDHEQKHSYADA
jgi:hydrogenase nickel incorporation protein HypA/HybF